MIFSALQLGKRLIVITALIGCAAAAAYPAWRYEMVGTTSLWFSGSGKLRLEGAARYYGVSSSAFLPHADSSRFVMVKRAPLWSPPSRAPSFTTTSDTMMLGDDPVIATTTRREHQEPATLQFAPLVATWVLIVGVAAALLVTLGLIDGRSAVAAGQPGPRP